MRKIASIIAIAGIILLPTVVPMQVFEVFYLESYLYKNNL